MPLAVRTRRRPYRAGMPAAIVTGASRGLGLALTRALSRARLAPRRRRARRRRARAAPWPGCAGVVAVPGDVADPEHRRALVEAAGGAIDLLVNNASILGPSPLPPLADYPLDELRARLRGQRLRAARARPAGAAAARAGARDRQRHLRRRGRAVRGLGRLRLVEGRARAADARSSAPSSRSCASTRSTPATCARRCTRTRSRARTSPTGRRPRRACPGCWR